MKQILITTFILISLGFLSCKKNTSSVIYSYSGTIEGPSPFQTTCGGKYWIVIDSLHERTTFNSVPDGGGVDLTSNIFPIKVNLNWHYASTPNTCDIIVIDQIAVAH